MVKDARDVGSGPRTGQTFLLTFEQPEHLDFKYVTLPDIEAISKAAGLPVLPDVDGAAIQARINAGFQCAFMLAANAEITPSPSEHRLLARDVAAAAKRLLNTLGYSGDPACFVDLPDNDFLYRTTQEEILGWSISRIAELSSPDDRLPLPFKIAREAQRRARMDQSSIAKEADKLRQRAAERKQPFPSWLSNRAICAQECGARALLDGLPFVLAFLISVCSTHEYQPESLHGKANFGRSFHRSLFRFLASTYYFSFGVPPQTADSNRAPKGPATRWMAVILRLASNNFVDAEASLTRTMSASNRVWFGLLRTALLDADQLRMATKAKQIGEAWRLANANGNWGFGR